MRLLCSPSAWRRHGERIQQAAPGLEPRFVGDAGGAQLAWCSFELWPEGLVDRFFAQADEDPELRWLHTSSAGLDRPEYARLVRRGVLLTNAHVTAEAIADYVLRAVLDVFQDAERWRQAQAAHRWEVHGFREVAGSCWLVIGLGAIGSGVARRARACGARVVGVRRHPRGDEPVDAVVTPDSLADALGDADVVLLAVPLTPSTDTLVDAEFLAALKPGAVLVNVGRGALVDEGALLASLDHNRPGAAVLDVFRGEPLPPDSPWWDHPRVVVTPHSSGIGHRADERSVEAFCANLARWTTGEPLEGEVDGSAFV